MKLKIRYEIDDKYNVTSVEILPNNRNAAEIANALTAALSVVLSRSLGLSQSDVARAIVESVKNLLGERQ